MLYNFTFTLDCQVDFNSENDDDAREFIKNMEKHPNQSIAMLLHSVEYEIDLVMRDDYELFENDETDIWGRTVEV